MTTWVFSEETDGAPSAASLEAATAARAWGEVAAFYVGTGNPAAFAALGDHGVTKVYHLDPGDALPSAAAAAAMADLAASDAPSVIMFSMGSTDRDVAGRLSARMGATVLSNAVALEVDGGSVVAYNEILGGSTKVATKAESGPVIVVTRPKAFPAEPAGGAEPAVVAIAMPETGHAGSAQVLSRHVEASEGPDLEEADVIISGGRGLGNADGFAMMDELAKLLGGAVGATRAVVDSGWVPYSYQIGQTGKTVKPSVYVACGISGAMQHLVGMKDATTIIAINKDPEAPIFDVSDLGIVGDVNKVVPALVEALKARS
ncbi:MAG: electron transfer flavoprotein subunit alpha/FixB family protein [Acidimicrobiia bacterium]|nr:electron transfer flavoprotein subunit alpha/FixB family protein [Acidimicrobiia bacterium]